EYKNALTLMVNYVIDRKIYRGKKYKKEAVASFFVFLAVSCFLEFVSKSCSSSCSRSSSSSNCFVANKNYKFFCLETYFWLIQHTSIISVWSHTHCIT